MPYGAGAGRLHGTRDYRLLPGHSRPSLAQDVCMDRKAVSRGTAEALETMLNTESE